MAVPKKRRSKSKKRTVKSNWKVKAPNLRDCSNCGESGHSHRVCMKCGFYNGKQVIQIKEKVNQEAA